MRRPKSERHKVMTVDEVCEYLRVHPTTIYRLIKQGMIPAFRVGGRWRFNVEDIEPGHTTGDRTTSSDF